MVTVIFFGSFQHYSTLIAQSLQKHPEIDLRGVVSTPPMPAGRNQILQKTHTHLWAQKQGLSVFTPPTLDDASYGQLKQLVTEKTDDNPNPFPLFVTAGYGKLLPEKWLSVANQPSLNLHFSLLPKFRGANPAEWAILLGEKDTGVTLMEMAEKFDTGAIISQASTAISNRDSRETLYQKLYALGAQKLPDMLVAYARVKQKSQFSCQQSLQPQPQPPKSPTPFASLFKRDDSFIPWPTIQAAIQGLTLHKEDFPGHHFQNVLEYLEKQGQSLHHDSLLHFIERATRALSGYPSLWTVVKTSKGDKRLKMHSASVTNHHLILDTVQLEGQQPALFNQIKNSIISQ